LPWKYILYWVITFIFHEIVKSNNGTIWYYVWIHISHFILLVMSKLFMKLFTVFYFLIVCLFICSLCLTPLSTIFQLYRGSQFYWWRKLQFLEKMTNCKYLLKYTGRQKLKLWEQNKFHNIIEFLVQLFWYCFCFYVVLKFCFVFKVFLRKSY
jgi:hypothetical protein